MLKIIRLGIIVLTVMLICSITATAKSKKSFKKDKTTKYAKTNVMVYEKATTASEPLDTFVEAEKIKIVGTSTDNKWHKVKLKKGKKGYVRNDNTISRKRIKKKKKSKKLTKSRGVVQGPSGRETYYNMKMSNVVSLMRSKGYSAKEYPYWVRKDGCKMLGKYIIVAANLKTRPKGTILDTSLGKGIVCDTGGFVRRHPKGLDIATAW